MEVVKAASPALQNLLSRYSDALLAQVLQSVACNALHSVKQRCARWMLMTLDRVDGGAVPLTQEHLAEMLGTHRVTVATTLHDLEEAGLIRRQRRRLAVLDRLGLEMTACECYAAVRTHFRALLPPTAVQAKGRRQGELMRRSAFRTEMVHTRYKPSTPSTVWCRGLLGWFGRDYPL